MKNALLLVDVVDEYLKPWGSQYIGHKDADQVIDHLKEQLKMARRTNTPVIYVTKKGGEVQGANSIVTDLAPEDDFLITRAALSAFDNTPLEAILRRMKIDHLIIAGVGTDSSILFTIYDAKARDFEVTVIEDCLAASERIYHAFALKVIRDTLEVDII